MSARRCDQQHVDGRRTCPACRIELTRERVREGALIQEWAAGLSDVDYRWLNGGR